MNALHVSWDEIHDASRKLAAELAALGQWQGIIAIARSGLVPAAIIAMELELRLMDTICISSYDGQTQRAAQILKAPNVDIKDGQGWLVIDDLVDTGQTAEIVRGLFPKAYLATLYAKPQGLPFVDCYVDDVAQHTWVYFPWDKI